MALGKRSRPEVIFRSHCGALPHLLKNAAAKRRHFPREPLDCALLGTSAAFIQASMQRSETSGTDRVDEANGEEDSHPRPKSHLGPFFVVINAASGAGGQRREARIREHFGEANIPAHFVPIGHPSKLANLLHTTSNRAQEEKGVLVLAGGDGTVNTALPFLLERDLPLGLLPSGTFNYVAREFGIPLDLKAAVKNLVSGVPIDAAVGQVNDRLFLVNASLGLYPRLLEDREKAKRKYGRNRALALAASVASLVSRRARSFDLDVQRGLAAGSVGAPHQLEIATLFIGNNALQLRRVGLEKETPSGEHLTAVALRVPSPLRLIELGVRATFGTLGESKDILSFPFERLTAAERGSRREGVKIALDGEVTRIPGPLCFEHAPKKLKLIVPAEES